MSIPTDKKQYEKIVNQVKARVSHWPSAYASGQVVKQYKQFMLEKGLEPYTNNKPDPKKGLQRWYNEKWIDIKTNKPCGSVKTQSYYPTCRPSKRVTAKSPITSNELTQKDKAHMIAQKQKAKSHTVYYKETTRI